MVSLHALEIPFTLSQAAPVRDRIKSVCFGEEPADDWPRLLLGFPTREGMEARPSPDSCCLYPQTSHLTNFLFMSLGCHHLYLHVSSTASHVGMCILRSDPILGIPLGQKGTPWYIQLRSWNTYC